VLPERLRAVIDLVAGSGLRQGEVFGLEVDALDFLRGRTVEVWRQVRLVFTLDNGAPMTLHQWTYLWQPAARTAGLPPRTGLHALRHLYVSLLIRHGESVKTVQKRLGHSSAAITLDTYAHLWPDADDRTRDAVQAALAAKINDPADTVRTDGRSS
jgi:integrase